VDKNEEMCDIDRELDKFYIVCLIQELIAEQTLSKIVRKYMISAMFCE